ncbi:hypothetical protein [Trichothermofontia sp.]
MPYPPSRRDRARIIHIEVTIPILASQAAIGGITEIVGIADEPLTRSSGV